MTRWCVVPNCDTNSRAHKTKRSAFLVPKNPQQLKKWVSAIPGITKLKPTNVVCEKHFDEKCIIREWIKRDSNDKIIAQVPYKRPKLNEMAVPTIFNEALENFMFIDCSNVETSVLMTTAEVLDTLNTKDALAQAVSGIDRESDTVLTSDDYWQPS